MKNMKLALSTLALATCVNLFAHSIMTTTYPEDGAMLMAQAERVELNFQNPIKVISLKVVGSQGKPVSVRFDRNADTTKHFQTMLPMLAPDSYTVHWKVMGEDGHMMKGSYGFKQH